MTTQIANLVGLATSNDLSRPDTNLNAQVCAGININAEK
jgi:hypothetical protein